VSFEFRNGMCAVFFDSACGRAQPCKNGQRDSGKLSCIDGDGPTPCAHGVLWVLKGYPQGYSQGYSQRATSCPR
jgi:hypothetical protein